MQADLEALKITSTELEKLTGFDVSDVFMGSVYRPSALRSPRRLLSLLATETLVLAVVFVLCLGVGLILVRNLENFDSTRFLFILTFGLAVAIAALWNLSMWLRGRGMTTLSLLLDEVDRHNDVINAVHIMDELGSVQASTLQLPNRSEVLTALQATRESLVCALMTEKILRKHKRFMLRRQELFANIETNLATLQTLTVNSQAEEYSQFLNEALEIGLTVHREMRKRDNY
jgi:hypothetical protein